VRDRKLTNPADKEAAIDEVLPYIRAVRSRLQKREYFDIAMDSLRIGDVGMRRELWQQVRAAGATGSVVTRSVERPIQTTAAEERLLGLLFTAEDLRHGVLQMLQPEDYEDLATAPVFRALLEMEKENVAIDFDSLTQRTAGDGIPSSLLSRLLMSESLHASNEHYAPEECIYTFRLMKVQQRIDETRAELAAAERVGDGEKVSRLSTYQTELEKLRSALHPKADAVQISH
jgi:hypothetical protein